MFPACWTLKLTRLEQNIFRHSHLVPYKIKHRVLPTRNSSHKQQQNTPIDHELARYCCCGPPPSLCSLAYCNHHWFESGEHLGIHVNPRDKVCTAKLTHSLSLGTKNV
jgi:hypothetical protein